MNLFVTQLQEAYALFKEANTEACLSKLLSAKAAYSREADNSNITLEDLLLFEGGVLYQLQRYEEALASFENALKDNPTSTTACLHLGKTLIQLGQYDSAKTMLEYAVLYDANNEIAVELLKKLEEANAQDVADVPEMSTLDNALRLFEEKHYEESLEVLHAVESEYKEMLAGVYNFQGFNLLALRQTAQAQKAFERAMLINPDSSQAYAGFGEVMYLLNNDAEAVKNYQKAIALNPNNHFALAGLKKTQQPSAAVVMTDDEIKRVEQAIENAFTSYSAKQYDEALAVLVKAEESLRMIKDVDPLLLSRMLNFKGFSYLGKQDKENARKAFEEALQVNPDSSQSATGLGEVFFLENNLQAAKEMYAWGIKLNPENKFAVSCLEKAEAALAKQ